MVVLVVSGSISEFLTKDEPFEQAPPRTIAEKKELAYISIMVIM